MGTALSGPLSRYRHLPERHGPKETPEQRAARAVREAEKPRFAAARANLRRVREVLERKNAQSRIETLDRVAGRLAALADKIETAAFIDPGMASPMEYLVEAAENAASKAEGGNLALVDEELARVEGWTAEIEGKVR